MNDFSLQLGTYKHYDSRRRRTRHRFYKIDGSQRQLHLYLLGKSGTGKSTATINWALQDIERGLGCLFIDPHDDDAETLLELIPAHRRRDVIYFNPAEFPVSFNVLDRIPEDLRPFVASSVVDMMKTIWKMDVAPNVDMFVTPLSLPYSKLPTQRSSASTICSSIRYTGTGSSSRLKTPSSETFG